MIRFDPTLIVERMRVARDGLVAYDENFHDGLNIISGDNSSGKSTILNFLFYALGGDLFDWSAVAKLCTKVYVQVRINGNVATLAREISIAPRRSMDIFPGEITDALNAGLEGWTRYPYVRSDSKESFSQVLFRLLNIPEVVNETSGNITINQMLRLLYADQITPIESLFKYQGAFDDANIRDAVGRLIFGAHSSEFYNNQTLIRILRKDYDELTGEYRSLIMAAGEVSEGFTHEWVRAERLNLISKLENVERDIIQLQLSILSSGPGKISVDRMTDVHRQVLLLQSRITEMTDDRDSLSVRMVEASRFMSSLETKLAALQDSSLVLETVGEIQFSECPACRGPIGSPLTSSCYLCKSPLDNGEDRSRITKLINDTALQLRQSKSLQEDRKSQSRVLDVQLQRLHGEYRTLADELQQLQNSAVPEEQSRLNALNRNFGYLRRQMDDIARMEELASKIEDLSARRATVRANIDELEAKNEALTQQQGQRMTVVSSAVAEDVKQLLKSDLRRQDVFEDPREVAFSFRENTISINEERYFSASSRAILKSTFVLALLSAAIKIPYMRHPRFAMIDSLENMGVEPLRSANFQELILEVSNTAGVEHQIIFATAMLSPKLNTSKYVVGRHYTRDSPTLAIG